MDKCGQCHDGFTPTDQNPCDCDEEMDDCGQCASPNSTSWNSCKKNFATLSSYTIDKMESDYVEIRLLHDDFNRKISMKQCNLNDVRGTNRINFEDVEVKKGFVKLGVNNTAAGSYYVICSTVDDVQYETGQNDILNIFNSLDVKVLSVEVSEGSEEGSQSVKIVTDLNQPNEDSVDEVFCFYRKAKNLKGSLFTNAKYLRNISTVECGEFTPLGGGVYQFGVLLTQSKYGFRNPQMSIIEKILVTGGPVAKRGFFLKNFGGVGIKFSTNIQGVDEKCAGIFTSQSSLIGQDPTCVGKANILEVNLGSDHLINNGTVLTLAPDNGIQELKADPNSAVDAGGSVTILTNNNDKLKKPDFTLTGPSEICPGRSVKVVVSNMKGFGRGQKDITWSTEGLNGTGREWLEQRNKRSLVIRPESLENTDNFKVFVTARNFLNFSSEEKSVSLKKISNSAMSVQILGPKTIRADQNLKLKVKTQQCGAGGNETKQAKYTVRY